jgi:sulfite exporter TauE/SafE
MCGPLHLAVCLSGGRRSFAALSTFNLGRIAGYTAIGFLCGLFGEQLTALAAPEPKVEAEVSAEHVDGQTMPAPKSCCEAEAQHAADGPAHAGGIEHQRHKKSLWRRGLMFLFPATILLASGIKALRKKPGVVGEHEPGIFGRLFNASRKGGPVAFGLAAALIPCGMLYYAFAVAVSTLSPVLGAVFLFVYSATISFFLQLGIMVGTTVGRNLGPKVDRAFPWLAFAGSGVYVTLFFLR